MKPFKINLKELIILIILSAPIGIFLFLNNYNKINYEIKARRGYAVTENFCENLAYQKIYLLKDAESDLVKQKYKSDRSNLLSRLSSQIRIEARSDSDIYIISIKGVVGDEESMAEVGDKLLGELLGSELSIFNSLYKTVKIHCNSGVFTVFKIVPLEKIDNEYPANKSYKNLHLGLLLILPLIIIYLSFIAFKYIRNISIKHKNY